MNKRVKIGPLLVVGALVVLVGVAVLLSPTPAPKPETPAADAEHSDKPKEAEKAPALDLAQVRKLIASADPHEQLDAVKLIQEGYQKASADEQVAAIALLKDEVLKGDLEAARVSALNTLRAVKQADTEMYINLAKADHSPGVREAAIDALGAIPDDVQVTGVLRSLAQDPDPGIRSAATRSLTVNLGNSSTAGVADLCALLGMTDNDMAAQAAMRLQQRSLKDPTVVPAVIKTLRTSASGPQRHGAALVLALACAGFNPSIDAFAKAAHVTHRQEFGERKSNLAGLQPLIEALQKDPYAPTREIAAQGLGYLGDVRAAKPLAAALKDSDSLVRRRAAAALVTVPAETVVPELSATVATDKDPEVRRFAVQALGWIATPAVAPALVKATQDQVAAVRQEAAVELGKLQLTDTSALDALTSLLDKRDPDADVRWAAVVALGKLNDRRAEQVLVRALSDPSPQVQNSAERALQRLGIARREQAGFQS